MLDGNRRWARAVGADAAQGHRAGAANISPLLEWCEEVGVEVVTLWLLSTDNLNRPTEELSDLLVIIEGLVGSLAAEGRWRLNPVGALDLLPAGTARTLKEAADETRDVSGIIVNIAVGYGGRREIADAVRSLLHEHASKGTSIEELAEIIDVEHIARHLYTKGQPDPDLVIRTSGEQRLGGLLDGCGARINSRAPRSRSWRRPRRPRLCANRRRPASVARMPPPSPSALHRGARSRAGEPAR